MPVTDLATLRRIDAGAAMTAGNDLQLVAQTQQVGYRDYVPWVVQPVQEGAIWRDDAQPLAGDVTHAMAKSFDTASTLMTSAATTCVTLSLELHAAKSVMNDVVDLAERIGFVVDADGNVTPGEDQKAGIEVQKKNGSPAAAHFEQLLYNQAEGYEKTIALAVKRATDADDACARLLREIDDKYLLIASVAYPGLRADADRHNEEAVELYGRVLQTQQHLVEEAKKAADRHDLERWGLLGQIGGIFKGLWSGVEGMWQLGSMMSRAWDGDPEAIAAVAQMVDQFELGDLIALDALEEGRWGEFIGVNAWWFIPMGKVGTLAGKSGQALIRTARQALTEAAAFGKVPAGVKYANNVSAAESRAVVAREFPEVLGVNADRFDRGIPGHATNCLYSAAHTDHTLATGVTSKAPPGAVTSARDLVQHYGGRPLENVGSYTEIVQKMENAGDGSRGIVLGTRNGMPGHAFNVVNRNGQIWFVDGQTGQLAYLENFAKLQFLPTN